MDTSKNIEISEQTKKVELKERAAQVGIVYKSEGMEKVLNNVEAFAPEDGTVLITGASGVGKDCVAQAIHEWSKRAKKEFNRVNCGAIPTGNLLQSELFGHEIGAFTDAKSQRIGLFELSDGGTIFLDEIGNMDSKSQESLLSVMDGKGFRRIGGKTDIKVNVRVVAATNADLEKAIKDGKFREDLYYRLNDFPIHIPPLCERKEDIPALITHFIDTSKAEQGTTVTGTTEEVAEWLKNADWEGNIRELKSAINAAIARSEKAGDKILEHSHFSKNITDKQAETVTDHSTDALNLVMQQQNVTLDALERADKNLYEEVLYTVDSLITQKEGMSKPTDLDNVENREAKGYVSRGRIYTFVEKCWKCFFPEDIDKPPTPGEFIEKCRKVWKTAREASTDTGNQDAEGNANVDMPPNTDTGNPSVEGNANTDRQPSSTTPSEREESNGRYNMTYAILLDKNVMEVYHYYPVSGKFSPDGNTSIATNYRVSQDTGQITLAETDPYDIELNVDHDGMDLSVTENPGDVKIDDLLLVLFQTVLQTGAAEVDKTAVCVASENPVIKRAALKAGFSEVSFLSFTDAAIREWEHVHGRDEASDVVALKCNDDGSLSWELQVLDAENDYFTPTNSGQFVPETTTGMEIEEKLNQGLTKFSEWNKTNGSRNVVVTGRQAQTDVVVNTLAMLQLTGYNVFSCEAVLGASKPPLPSKHARFDTAIERVKAAEAVRNFDSAVEHLQSAEAIFPSPSGEIRIGIDQLKGRIRAAILSEAEEAQTSERAAHLYKQALTLSTTDKERSAAYACLVDSNCEIENFVGVEVENFPVFSEWGALALIKDVSQQLCDFPSFQAFQDIKQSIAEETEKWESKWESSYVIQNFSAYVHDKPFFQPSVIKQAADLLPGSLHRLNDNFNVVLVGPTGSGKTALAHKLYGDEVDVPDRAKAILRLPFANGFTLWDTPGLLSDEDSNTTRAWLGLEQQPGTSISHINFVDAGLQSLAYQHLPIETLAEKFSREEAVILFVFDLTMTDTKLKNSTVIADLEALREIYGKRLFVIGTFADQFSEWTPLARKKRREIWSERIGNDWVEYSAVTKEGLLEIVRRILQAAGRDASELLPHLKSEKKALRFLDSLHRLSKLMRKCMQDLNEESPYPDLEMRLLVLWVAYLTWQRIDIDDASWILVKSKVRETIRDSDFLLIRREVWPYLSRRRWYNAPLRYHTPDKPALVKIFVLIYGLLYDDAFTIESPRIEDWDLEQWLAAEMEEIYIYNLLDLRVDVDGREPYIIIRGDEDETLVQQLETIWVELFRRFHPSALSALPMAQPDEDEDEN